jgi:hypothetical protein
MGKFKNIYLLESTVKDSIQKSLGLRHISFNNYKDKVGNNWHWDNSKKKFSKSIENINISKEEKSLGVKLEKIDSDVYYSKTNDRFYYNDLDWGFIEAKMMLNSSGKFESLPKNINKDIWGKIQSKYDKEKLHWEETGKNLELIENRLILNSHGEEKLVNEVEKVIEGFGKWFRVPKYFKKVNVSVVSKESIIEKAGGNVQGCFYSNPIYKGILLNETFPKDMTDTLLHEIGHYIDDGVGEESLKEGSSFNAIIKKVKEGKTIRDLEQSLKDGYIISYRFDDNLELEEYKIILDENILRVTKYLLDEEEIFARLFCQYILKKVYGRDMNVNKNNSYNIQWPKEEFDKIYWEMDNLFKQKGWVK